MRIEDRSLPRIIQNLLTESRVCLKSATLVKISTDCCVLDYDWRAMERAVTTKVLRLDSCIRFNEVIFNRMAHGGKLKYLKY